MDQQCTNINNTNTEIGLTGHQSRHGSLDSTSSRVAETDTAAVVNRFTITPNDSTSQTPNPKPTTTTYKAALNDEVSVALVCPVHRAIALRKVNETKGVWFPSAPVDQSTNGGSLRRSALTLAQEVLTVTTNGGQIQGRTLNLIHTLRIQCTGNPQCFLTRSLYFAELEPSLNPEDCCVSSSIVSNQNTSTPTSWHLFSQLPALSDLWGHEPLTLANRYNLLHQQNSGESNNRGVFCLPQAQTELTLEHDLNPMWSGQEPEYEMLRAAINGNRNHLLALYAEYAQHCFPSDAMSRHAFLAYIIVRRMPLLAPSTDRERIFSAFCRNHSTQQTTTTLSLPEFVLGLAALDFTTQHGNKSGLERLGYIFRYYQLDTTTNEMSNEASQEPNAPCCLDLTRFTADLMSLHGLQTPPEETTATNGSESFQISVRNLEQVFRNSNPSSSTIGGITFAMFKQTVGSLVIRGTSNMFRVVHDYHPLLVFASRPFYDSNMGMGPCARCNGGQKKDNGFYLAKYSVTMLPNGRTANPTSLASRACRSARSTDKAIRSRSTQQFSRNTFNLLMEQIRAYHTNLKCPNIVRKNSITVDWVTNRGRWSEAILTLCAKAREVMTAEARIIQVKAPVFVFGDLHGNLTDLLAMEAKLWPGFPAALAANYLFLGDYVDRGDHSVEVITYLLCAKVLAPTRFQLVRGNHEFRAIQLDYTFERECREKFGQERGRQLWEAFNLVFDCMPICAVIDRSIFCAHGGIPASILSLELIEPLLPCPLVMMTDQDLPVAWEMLWNDPAATEDEFNQMLAAANNNLIVRGVHYVPNLKRSTGYYFSEQAVHAFLRENNLSFVIRAHEMCLGGFAYHASGRCITVFSCSNYVGEQNDGAVVLVTADGKIRPIVVCPAVR